MSEGALFRFRSAGWSSDMESSHEMSFSNLYGRAQLRQKSRLAGMVCQISRHEIHDQKKLVGFERIDNWMGQESCMVTKKGQGVL
jgi:hypothetical protein